jgi:hypothetical protein
VLPPLLPPEGAKRTASRVTRLNPLELEGESDMPGLSRGPNGSLVS